MTVYGDHVECYRHHVCNAVFPSKVCQTWSEKKRAMINKMIERKKLEAAKKSATVTLQKFPLWGTLVLVLVLKFPLLETEQSRNYSRKRDKMAAI